MKKNPIGFFASVLLSLPLLSGIANATEHVTTINVALLDMSSVMGAGMITPGGGSPGFGTMMPGQGMMAPGGGPGWGMMAPGGGPGWGMMAPGGGMMGMGMMSIRTDQPTVKTGNVRFVATNWSQGLVHEMIVVAVDNPTAPLPYDYSIGVIPEEQVKELGEIDNLQPNETGTLDIHLKPGTYLLICNIPGHFAARMVTALTVTP